jgi:hypothetical protein
LVTKEHVEPDQSGTPAVGEPTRGVSPELTGGAGFTYEDGVAGVYAAALLAEGTAPGLPGRQVKRLAVQQGSLGSPLDDIVVDSEGVDGARVRLSIQVKRALVISSAASNTPFRDTVLQAYATIEKKSFNVGLDRVGVVTGDVADDSKRQFETLCEWARADRDVESFVAKMRTPGVSGEKESHFDVIRQILSGTVPEENLDVAAHRLLSHFVLMRFEMQHEGSVLEAQTVSSLANHLRPEDLHRADDLWRRLLALVRVAQGHSAVFERPGLIAKLNGQFRLNGAPSMQAALSRLAEEAALAVAEVGNVVGGVNIPREQFVRASREALGSHRVVQIGGLPGTGKSVVLRSLVEEAVARGPVLFLKADRLEGATWAQYAAATGLAPISLEALLVELAATGTPTIFIDGLDRVEVRHRGILLDLFNTMLGSPLLDPWRVLATARDTGIEPLRTWLPSALLTDGSPVVDVTGFDDTEATSLAAAVPALAPLLFGTEDLRAIVRRPFFAGVLLRAKSTERTLSSEIDLASVWWTGGGYGAEAARAGRRRGALIALAQAGATTLGRTIPALSIDQEALAELVADGIVRDLRPGQTVRFTHDIYFEWSFLQLLIARGEQWLSAIHEVGEPPVLGRVVELLSQAELREGTDWNRHLELLETATHLRTQWLRAWLLGPFGLPSFRSYESTYTPALLANNANRVSKLAVWFQAEKTKANPRALDESIAPTLTWPQRIRLADSIAWPSDLDTWRRCCWWLLSQIENLAPSFRADILAVFEVWQNYAADVANPVSARIVNLVGAWLAELEAGGWSGVGHEYQEEIEGRLRALLLRAARAYPALATEYLSELKTVEHLPRSTFEQVLSFAPILSEVCPAELVDLTLHVALKTLPGEIEEPTHGLPIGRGSHLMDWKTLAVDDEHQFSPCAPNREPFPSLFRNAPTDARRLVSGLANHAIAAWHQLHTLDRERRATPLPLTLTFPWGDQTFWGAAQEYLWSRGQWGSSMVSSALMALETWAFEEAKKQRSVDEILSDVIRGHESVAAIAIAVALTIETKHCSTTTLPLVTSQRVWAWDIARTGAEMGGLANLFGFDPNQRRFYEAVVEGNKRQCRRLDVRWLVPQFIFDEGALGRDSSEAIGRFLQDLPVDYAEERLIPERIAGLKRQAEIWAEHARRENYRGTPTPDGDAFIVRLENPKAQGPDIDRIVERHNEIVTHLTLINWTHDCFKKSAVGTALSLEEATSRARQLDGPTLFSEAYPFVGSGRERQNAVVGVASVILVLGRSLPPEDLQWAAGVCLRAWKTPEVPDELYSKASALVDHPAIHAGRGLAGMARHRTEPQREVLEALFGLAAHFYDQVVKESLGRLLAGC